MSPELSGSEPKTFQDALNYFSNEDNCIRYLVSRRWPDGIVRCPECGREAVRFLASRRLWECANNHRQRQFSVRARTIFAESHISLDQWLITIWLLANPEGKLSSYKLARRIGVTQKTAWLMLRRIRIALALLNNEEFSGHFFRARREVNTGAMQPSVSTFGSPLGR